MILHIIALATFSTDNLHFTNEITEEGKCCTQSPVAYGELDWRSGYGCQPLNLCYRLYSRGWGSIPGSGAGTSENQLSK